MPPASHPDPRDPDTRVPIVEMRGISKAFPGVRALDDVSLAVHAGEVHMLLGQNGAGKSTLIKVLYGAYHPDRGEFLFDGQPVRIAVARRRAAARHRGHLPGVLARSAT